MKKAVLYFKNGLIKTEHGGLLPSATFGALCSRRHQCMRPRSMDALMDFKFPKVTCENLGTSEGLHLRYGILHDDALETINTFLVKVDNGRDCQHHTQ